jgi:hypothetical protein
MIRRIAQKLEPHLDGKVIRKIEPRITRNLDPGILTVEPETLTETAFRWIDLISFGGVLVFGMVIKRKGRTLLIRINSIALIEFEMEDQGIFFPPPVDVYPVSRPDHLIHLFSYFSSFAT